MLMPKSVSVEEYAKRALSDAADVNEAAKRMEKYAKEDPDLFRALTAPFLPEAARRAVEVAIRHERKKVWSGSHRKVVDDAGRVMAHALSLMDFRLPGGIQLRRATRSDLLSAADFYGKQAVDMGHKQRWLTAIANEIDAKSEVGKKLTEERLAALKEETSHA